MLEKLRIVKVTEFETVVKMSGEALSFLWKVRDEMMYLKRELASPVSKIITAYPS